MQEKVSLLLRKEHHLINLEGIVELESHCLANHKAIIQSKIPNGGACVAQSVERPTSAQVMISRFVSSSPASGSVLTDQSLEPASDSVSPSLSIPPLFMLF